jgi:hypothetical protein
MERLKYVLFFVFSYQLIGAQINCESGNCINGTGVCIYPSGARYEGHFKDGKPAGKGILLFSDGRKYNGDWKEGYREGLGILTHSNGDKYTGKFEFNKYEGKGIMTYANGNRYEGEWQDGKQHGQGKFFYANGDRYEGSFYNGRCEGDGVMFYNDGSLYEGQWSNNVRNGTGVLLFSDGQKIAGEWVKGQYVSDWSKYAFQGDTSTLPNCNAVFCERGRGKYTYSDGSVYIGDFYYGLPEGVGNIYYANGNRYEGGWKQHTPHGQGVMYYASGRVVGAIWDYGKAVNKLFVQGEAEGPAPVPVEYDKRVKIWAVIVGAAMYKHMPTLRYTDDDAYQLYAFLKSPEGGALPDRQLKLLIDEEATHSNMMDAMRSTFLRADENDVILFYFSGHGLQGSFLPVDFDGYNNQIKHTDLKRLLESSKAKHKLILADACHSGSLLAMKSPLKGVLQRYYKAFENTEGGMALLMSSKGEEYSLEDGGLRSGIFSHFLVRGLKGEADQDANLIVSIQELFDYVHKNVRMYTGNIQTPTLTGLFDPLMPVAVVRQDP